VNIEIPRIMTSSVKSLKPINYFLIFIQSIFTHLNLPQSFLKTSTELGAIKLARIIERVNAAMRTVVIGGRRGVEKSGGRGTSSDMSQKSFVME
jgi:hypothetical protein